MTLCVNWRLKLGDELNILVSSVQYIYFKGYTKVSAHWQRPNKGLNFDES